MDDHHGDEINRGLVRPNMEPPKMTMRKRAKKKKQHPATPTQARTGAGNPLMHWNVAAKKDLPVAEHIKKLHVYDFDSTLFRSPPPNPNLFQDNAVGLLTSPDYLANGGWWKEPLILRSLGEGWDIERERSWEGYWNEDIISLMKMSMEEEETLVIVMTGRKRDLFANIIHDILSSRGLIKNLDGLVLKKGDFKSTIEYKTQVLVDILDHYTNITEVTIYDDRKSQLNGFSKCLNEYTEAVRPSLIANMVPVFCVPAFLDPKVEREVVEQILVAHNKSQKKKKPLQMKKSFLYDAYYIDYRTRANIIKILVERFPDIFNDEMLSSFRFQVDAIPILRGQMSKLTKQQVKTQPEEIEWKVSRIGSSNDLCAVQLEAMNIEKPVSLHHPPLLGIAAKGKSGQRKDTSEFLRITEWRDIPDDMEHIIFKTKVASIISFRITAESGGAAFQKRDAESQIQDSIP